MTDKEKATRPYEVPVTITRKDEPTENRVYLIDAKSAAAARRHVADKFVGEASLCNGKRVIELMSAPHHCKPETAEE